MDWPGFAILGGLVGASASLPLLIDRVHDYRLSQAGLNNLAAMTDADMTLHMARLFSAMGYRVFRPNWPGAGFALILVDGLNQKRGVHLARWRSPVDAEVVAQVAAATAQLGGSAPMIVTVQYYTHKARVVAAKSGAILWTLRELKAAIGRAKRSAVAYPELPVIDAPAQLSAALAGPESGRSKALQIVTAPLPRGPERPR